MLSAVDIDSANIATPTETVHAKPSALRLTAPILDSVGITAEMRKFRRSRGDVLMNAGPASERMDAHVGELCDTAYQSARLLTERHPTSPAAWARRAQAAHNVD